MRKEGKKIFIAVFCVIAMIGAFLCYVECTSE